MIKLIKWTNLEMNHLVIHFEINGKEFQRFSTEHTLNWWAKINTFTNDKNYCTEEQTLELESIVKAYFDTEGKFKEQLQIEN